MQDCKILQTPGKHLARVLANTLGRSIIPSVYKLDNTLTEEKLAIFLHYYTHLYEHSCPSHSTINQDLEGFAVWRILLQTRSDSDQTFARPILVPMVAEKFTLLMLSQQCSCVRCLLKILWGFCSLAPGIIGSRSTAHCGLFALYFAGKIDLIHSQLDAGSQTEPGCAVMSTFSCLWDCSWIMQPEVVGRIQG